MKVDLVSTSAEEVRKMEMSGEPLIRLDITRSELSLICSALEAITGEKLIQAGLLLNQLEMAEIW